MESNTDCIRPTVVVKQWIDCGRRIEDEGFQTKHAYFFGGRLIGKRIFKKFIELGDGYILARHILILGVPGSAMKQRKNKSR